MGFAETRKNEVCPHLCVLVFAHLCGIEVCPFFFKIFLENMNDILNELCDTQIYSIFKQMESFYQKIQIAQADWYKKTQLYCPEGCGECCRNFELDLLECEAVYMAVWLMQNQRETAQKVMDGNFPFNQNKGCPFWNENSPFHCSIYEGRGFICRLFGASGFRAKEGRTVWKPCRFYPADLLCKQKIPLDHRQYSQDELNKIFGIEPPVMSDLMQQAVEIQPDQTETKMIREILPTVLKRINWILQLKKKSKKDDDNDDDNGNDTTPLAS